MKVETRVFDRGKSNERRFLILIPDQVESEQLDFVFGDRVGEDGHIAKVKGSVKTCRWRSEIRGWLCRALHAAGA